MKHTFRWFGAHDPVTLAHIRQAGATGVVTALHHIANGEVWEVAAIEKVKNAIEAVGLEWTFIESIPVHENIKLRQGDFRKRIDNYKQSLVNAARCGIHQVCYNFMPVLDWTRTRLFWELPHGGTALRFDIVEMAAFELFLMQRPGAEKAYTSEVLTEAETLFAKMSASEKQVMEDNILKGLPGTVEDLSMSDFKAMLSPYDGLTHQDLKSNLSFFLNEVIPVAEEHHMVMAIHPDDPPIDIMGLPRIVKSEQDLEDLISFVDSPANGITLCTGSLGANPEVDLPKIVAKFADRIHFLHLRNVRREADGSFYEDNHLDGSVDMYAVVAEIMNIEQQSGREIPMRPDHGHQLLDDLNTSSAYCGYSAIGRLKGLAELRGLELGIKRTRL